MKQLLKPFAFFFVLALLSCKESVEKTAVTEAVQETIVAEKDSVSAESLIDLATASVHIGEFDGKQFAVNKGKENEIFDKMKTAIKAGALVSDEAVFELIARDGTGENQLTSKKILQLLLENYQAGPKQDLLDKLLVSSILRTNHEIIAYLISEGAKPDHDEITEAISGISPDYYPGYETMRLLVEELGFDLYKNCDVTLIWWAIQEDNFFGDSVSKKILEDEFAKRKETIFLKCNQTNDGEPFFDRDLFPVDKTALELATSSESLILKEWSSKLKQ